MPPEGQRELLGPLQAQRAGRDPARVKKWLRLLWLAALLLTIAGSVLPSDSRPMLAVESLPLSDKFEHFTAYAVLAFLPAMHERARLVFAFALGAIALGVALEYVQLYSGWRDFEFADMAADAAGVCVGLAAALVLRSVRSRSAARRSCDTR